MSATMITIRAYHGGELTWQLPRLEEYALRRRPLPLSRHPAWLEVLAGGLGHRPHCLEAIDQEQTVGLLPLAHVHSLLFGKFLVSLPYLNTAGAFADNDTVAGMLIDGAARLADELKVRYLELRHDRPVEHRALTARLSSKVHLRLRLPGDTDQLWKDLDAKVRNQVRKGRKHGLTVHWGGEELLAEFYTVFSHNMRDLGTPVYGRALFRGIVRRFPERAEFCVVRRDRLPVAAALLLHGWGITEVPSAGALREFNPLCANMLMYWHLLERAVLRGQSVFDFGRSTKGSGTCKFKEQWGALPEPAAWQYYLRNGAVGDMRPDNPQYQRLIRLWQRLPVSVTRLIGPPIVRGIP
jgi:FemAB-related protein (PEP-CTERM system-associated)